MPDVIGFLPSSRGFSFGNRWPPQPDKVIPTPFGGLAIGDATNGLCGGMVFAVRDYFEANITPPSGGRPTLGQPLYDFIVDRLFACFDLPNGPAKYYDWMTTPDHDTRIKTGLARRTILEEWPRIKDDLDNNRLACLGLVTIFSLNPGDMGANHQILAYGYELGADNILTLKLYDPNTPLNDNVRLSLSIDNPGSATPINHNVNMSHPIRGFFHVPYQWVSPPRIDDAEIVSFLAPLAMPAGTNSVVTLQVKNTGTTTWSSGGANPYRLGSQRPQDNMLWGVSRVELPHAVNPTDAVNFTFAVTAPMVEGEVQVPMGWRMVSELVQWFGELEDRTVTVTGPIMPADPCDQMRSEILATEQEIRDLQTDLRSAAGSMKVFIASQIRMRQRQLTRLRNEATTQGCSDIP